MNTLDLLIVIPIALGFVFGLFKGLVKELASLASIVLGIYGAKAFAPSLSGFLIRTLSFSPKTALPLSYLFLFILIATVLILIAKSLDSFFESIALGGINKLLGGLFAAFKYALVVSVLLNLFQSIDSYFSVIKPKSKIESMAYAPVLKLAPALWVEGKNTKVFDFKDNSNNETQEIQNHR